MAYAIDFPHADTTKPARRKFLHRFLDALERAQIARARKHLALYGINPDEYAAVLGRDIAKDGREPLPFVR